MSKSKDDFTSVVVIFNPNSTGSGKEMAQALKRKLSKYDVQLIETEYAGHAEELAYKYAKATSRPLIISASGDGGYHEVINGLIKAQLKGANPTAGLLPAGNANDHYNDVHDNDISRAIIAGKIQKIDLLKLKTTIDNKLSERYAHSYIGFGLTPKIGNELNKVNLNRLNEIWIVMKALFILRPVKIMHDGRKSTYDSLIFSNVSKMSKVLSLSDSSSNQDGKFEVTIFKRRNKLQLIKLLVQASTSGLSGNDRNSSYVFKTIKEILVQIDGEVSTVNGNSDVLITIERQMLSCIV